MVAPGPNRINGMGGWLWLLCGVLLIYQPLSLAWDASMALVALPIRGISLGLVLVVRLIVTAVGIGAGLALAQRRPGAVTFAKVSLVLSAAMDLFVYTTRYVPNNRTPGTTPLFAAASLVFYALWFGYLVRSARVRATFD